MYLNHVFCNSPLRFAYGLRSLCFLKSSFIAHIKVSPAPKESRCGFPFQSFCPTWGKKDFHFNQVYETRARACYTVSANQLEQYLRGSFYRI